jgi:hypothetical protein
MNLGKGYGKENTPCGYGTPLPQLYINFVVLGLLIGIFLTGFGFVSMSKEERVQFVFVCMYTTAIAAVFVLPLWFTKNTHVWRHEARPLAGEQVYTRLYPMDENDHKKDRIIRRSLASAVVVLPAIGLLINALRYFYD